jgi:hypothetical protein
VPTHHNEELVVALARAMVATIDPDRLRYFDADAEAYFDDPRHAIARTGGDTPLGSGLETFVAALTPVALYVAGKVIDYVTQETIAEAGKRVRHHWALRRRPSKRARVITTDSADSALRDIRPLSAEEVGQIRRLVVDAAKECGVTADAADDLAGAVLAHLPRQTGTAGG